MGFWHPAREAARCAKCGAAVAAAEWCVPLAEGVLCGGCANRRGLYRVSEGRGASEVDARALEEAEFRRDWLGRR